MHFSGSGLLLWKEQAHPGEVNYRTPEQNRLFIWKFTSYSVARVKIIKKCISCFLAHFFFMTVQGF